MSPQFWSELAGGVNQHVVQPMVADADRGHAALNEHYPLPYAAAQTALPLVGIAAAAMDYRQALRAGGSADGAVASLSGVPVHERAYGAVGSAAPTSITQAATSHPIPGAGAVAAFAPRLFGGLYKAAAGVNAAQIGKASYDQFKPRGYQ